MKRTTGSMITFNRPDGMEVQGYLARPQKPEGAPEAGGAPICLPILVSRCKADQSP